MKNSYLVVGSDNYEYISEIVDKKNLKQVLFLQKQTYEKICLVIFSYNISFEKANKEIKKINKLNNPLLIFLPKKLNKIFINPDHKIIFFPIKISLFEQVIESTIFNNFNVGDIFVEGNYIINKKNDKKIYFTETQTNILKLLISLGSIDKEKIKKDVLNINSLLDTKSLESHLSRIRKKLLEINSRITIISTDNKKIKLLQ